VVVCVVVVPGVVTVVVRPGVVIVFVVSVPVAWSVVPVGSSTGWTAVFTLVATVETARCNVPDPPDPHALSAQAINAPATSATAILAASFVPMRAK
jgi:hypothetical protein